MSQKQGAGTRRSQPGKRDITKREFIVVGAVVGTVIGIVIALFFLFFVVNPTTQENHTDLKSQGNTLRDVACAQAQSTANAFRYRQVGPNEKLESVEHFKIRMVSQRGALIAALPLNCPSSPNFPPFKLQVARALAEIEAILHPRQRHLPKAISRILQPGAAAHTVTEAAAAPPEVTVVRPPHHISGGTNPTPTHHNPPTPHPTNPGESPPGSGSNPTPAPTQPTETPASHEESGGATGSTQPPPTIETPVEIVPPKEEKPAVGVQIPQLPLCVNLPKILQINCR